jgi:uncharacterized protein YidB (DUF937 family)
MQPEESAVGLLQNVIRSAVISALGANLARGRSPIVGALIALLLSRALAKKADEKKPHVPGPEDGLGGLVERFRQGGFEEIIKSWIGTGPNKLISPNQLHQALGPTTRKRPRETCRAEYLGVWRLWLESIRSLKR